MPRTALWQAIRDTLADEIAQARYAAGDRLPTEAQLAARFGVNRHTVRRALAALAGVFVTPHATDYPLGRRVRFHRNLHAAGRMPGRQALMLDTRTADAHEAAALALGDGARVHVYEGVSTADDVPIALFRSVFPAARFPGLLARLHRDPSVTAAFAAEGLDDYVRAETRLTARLATATQARQLHLPEGAALLHTVAIDHDLADRPVEFGKTWFVGERVTLTTGLPQG